MFDDRLLEELCEWQEEQEDEELDADKKLNTDEEIFFSVCVCDGGGEMDGEDVTGETDFENTIGEPDDEDIVGEGVRIVGVRLVSMCSGDTENFSSLSPI